MADTCILKYIGVALPTGATSNDLYNSVTAWSGANFVAENGFKRLVVSIQCDQAGTLTWSKSVNRGVTWLQIGTQAVAATTSTSEATYDFYIAEYADFKIVWVNGGVTQTVFNLSIALDDERSPLT